MWKHQLPAKEHTIPITFCTGITYLQYKCSVVAQHPGVIGKLLATPLLVSMRVHSSTTLGLPKNVCMPAVVVQMHGTPGGNCSLLSGFVTPSILHAEARCPSNTVSRNSRLASTAFLGSVVTVLQATKVA